MKTKRLITGILLILLAVIVAYGATYVYEYFEGNAGREAVTFFFGLMISFGLIFAGLYTIIE